MAPQMGAQVLVNAAPCWSTQSYQAHKPEGFPELRSFPKITGNPAKSSVPLLGQRAWQDSGLGRTGLTNACKNNCANRLTGYLWVGPLWREVCDGGQAAGGGRRERMRKRKEGRGGRRLGGDHVADTHGENAGV